MADDHSPLQRNIDPPPTFHIRQMLSSGFRCTNDVMNGEVIRLYGAIRIALR